MLDREPDNRDRPAADHHDRASGAVDDRRLRKRREGTAALEDHRRDAARTAHRQPAAGGHVDAQDDVGVEHLQERLEVACAGGRQEGVDDLALTAEVGVGPRRRAAHAPPGAARQLPRGLGCAVDDRRDLVEGNGEHVVQHEGEPLGRRQRLEDDQEREADGVGE